MTPYEIARRAVAPFMPALEGEVAGLLADEGFVRNLARVVRPGGPVVLTTPNGDARPVHGADHRRHYRRDQLVKLVTPYFDVVFVRYAVAMTDNRLVGMRSLQRWRRGEAAKLVACSGPGSRGSSRCRLRVW